MTVLEQLKELADKNGIEYRYNSGEELLKSKLVDHGIDISQIKEDAPIKFLSIRDSAEAPKAFSIRETPAETIKRAMKQIHVEITCLHPDKQEYQGEIITVGNAVMPEKKMMVVYNHPTHIPQIMYDVLLSKRHLVHLKKKSETAGFPDVNYTKLVPTYSIQVLPDLTIEEIEAIKLRQLATNSVDNE